MSSFDDDERPGIIQHVTSFFTGRNAGSSVAVYSSTSSGVFSSAAHSPSSYTTAYISNRPLSPSEVDRVREELMKELREEGKLIDDKNTTLRPMDEERRKRKIDSILEDAKDE